MNAVTITKTTGFNYYGQGSITFDVDGKEVVLSTITSPNKFLELTEEAKNLNAELVTLLNCAGDEEDEETGCFPEDLEMMNDVLAELEFNSISAELYSRTATIEDLFAAV